MFRGKHKNILKPIRACINDSEKIVFKESTQESYSYHLERLNLIKPHHSIDTESGLPEYDRFTGDQVVTYWTIAPLGRLLLKQIGFKKADRAYKK